MRVSFNNLPYNAVNHPLFYKAVQVSDNEYELTMLNVNECIENAVKYLKVGNKVDSPKIKAIKSAKTSEEVIDYFS